MDKQIEEIGQDIADICSDMALNCCGSTPCYACIAKRLERKGYRKIPENAVVLTREEYENLQALKGDYVKGYEAGVDEGWDNARKETAEKFAERVKMAFYYEFDELIPSIMSDKIDEIAKEITEGK